MPVSTQISSRSTTPAPPAKSKLASIFDRLAEPLIFLGPAGIWLLLLLVLPTLIIFELSLVPDIRPGQVVNPSGFDNFCRAFGFEQCLPSKFDPTFLQVMKRTLFFAGGSTIACLVLGFPVAYWIAVMSPKQWRNLLLLGFVLPLWTSSLLRSYAWITILRPSGVINSFLQPALNPLLSILNWLIDSCNSFPISFNIPFLLPHLPLLPWNLLNDWPAVLIGMSYSYLPYMVLILYSSLEKLDRRLLEASADLGANPAQTFWKVTVPQTMPGIVAGSLLVLIIGVGDFIDPELLGGASSMTISRLIYNQFLGATQNWGFGSALSMVLILAVSIAIALLLKFGDRNAAR
ncbi:ABC transporter permease [Aerosakkonema funiforme]|uniref:ABC transporter permease n=2 Tax=Oscillatoriophycideae TaxID=1301283 RepID=A0A926VDX8_9CYAN|nr:ABC transporter permease [Aerosakkonema funiforme]MBD2181785.1 ABC transporter permease [Aerosakkonema funiforme FACHB-1375]